MITGLRPVGVAGCGRMGLPMLRAIREAGFEARGFDIRPPAEFAAMAPYITDDPEEFAGGLRTLLVVVRDEAQCDDVLFGAAGLAERAPLGFVVLHSTLSPTYVTELRERLPFSIRLVDAPMAGDRRAAQHKQLRFLLGASLADLDMLAPLLTAMGRDFEHMGPLGAGMRARVLTHLRDAADEAARLLAHRWGIGLDPAKLNAAMGPPRGENVESADLLGKDLEALRGALPGGDADGEGDRLIAALKAALNG